MLLGLFSPNNNEYCSQTQYDSQYQTNKLPWICRYFIVRNRENKEEEYKNENGSKNERKSHKIETGTSILIQESCLSVESSERTGCGNAPKQHGP